MKNPFASKKPKTTANLDDKTGKIDCAKFYEEYRGHTVPDLQQFYSVTRKLRPDKPIIWFAGDSSLDNKYWVPSPKPGGDPLPVPVPQIYQDVLEPPLPRPDVAFWVNHIMGDRATCINTSIEESMVRNRDGGKLLAQDKFLQENMRDGDVLITSVGGNDIALYPTPATIYHLLRLAWFTRKSAIEDGSATSLQYFRNIFQFKTNDWINRLVATAKPRTVIVCIIYYPLESQFGQKSWAGVPLSALGYRWWPGQLQAAIKSLFTLATTQVQVEGTTVVPCPLFEIMNGKTPEDYTERVEPSAVGGRKMAEKFAELLGEGFGVEGGGSSAEGSEREG